MNILFVHQSFPGQYRYIVHALAAQGCHNLVALGISELSEPIPHNITYYRYGLDRPNTPGLHEWLLDVDSKLIRGQACASAAVQLRDKGFTPDIICAHPGWGEALFLKDIWPNSPLLFYQEFFYNSIGFDYDFDDELQGTPDWQACARLRIKNANPLLTLQASTWNVTPTNFQLSSFPLEYQSRISVIHDGIDTKLASPELNPNSYQLSDGTILSSDEPFITFVNRRFEPYRGCHIFTRSIPLIQLNNPRVRIVIIGSTEGVSYGNAPKTGSWKDKFLQEIEGQYDSSRVHFTGPLPYQDFLQLLKLSSCHVYLTYPFVLSWSLLEAMSIGLPVVASSTPPLTEIISNHETGLLFDFFSPSQLAECVNNILSNKSLASYLGANARQHILNNYSIEKCVPRQLSLIELVATGALN